MGKSTRITENTENCFKYAEGGARVQISINATKITSNSESQRVSQWTTCAQ
jgi:hypothetical protein